MAALLQDGNGEAIQAMAPLSTTALSFSGTAQSTSSYTQGLIVRLATSEDCFINFSGTATNQSMYLPSGAVEYFTIKKGQSISALQVSTSGTLYITVMD